MEMRNGRLFVLAAAVAALVFATGLSAAAGDLDPTFDGDGLSSPTSRAVHTTWGVGSSSNKTGRLSWPAA
jgi:hypothetical protein